MIFVVVIIFSFLFSYYSFIPRKSPYFILELRDYSETLLAAGWIEFSKVAELSLPSSGIVQAIFVEEGEWVKEGDLLISLDKVWGKNQLQLIQKGIGIGRNHAAKDCGIRITYSL